MTAPPFIINLVGQLPVNPNGPYGDYDTRDEGDILYGVIHHTAGSGDETPQAIAAYHVNTKGWAGIGYHFLVYPDAIYQTNLLTTSSAHIGRLNPVSVGICLPGDFTNAPPPAAQLGLARRLTDWLAGKYPAWQWWGHGELALLTGATEAYSACPRDTWPTWRASIGC